VVAYPDYARLYAAPFSRSDAGIGNQLGWR
jgi:hypothetical protein